MAVENDQPVSSAQGKWYEFLHDSTRHPIVAPLPLHPVQTMRRPRLTFFAKRGEREERERGGGVGDEDNEGGRTRHDCNKVLRAVKNVL